MSAYVWIAGWACFGCVIGVAVMVPLYPLAFLVGRELSRWLDARGGR